MASRICSKVRRLRSSSSMLTCQSTSLTRKWSNVRTALLEDNQVYQLLSNKTEAVVTSTNSRNFSRIRQCASMKAEKVTRYEGGTNVFHEMKERFLRFKKQKFLVEAANFQNLAKAQSPKFLVIACVDSRVCPSNILGFQPGEAFMVRNVANLVPSFTSGPSETGAALEFAVKTLEVEHILVIGHSCCAGIEALMNMKIQDANPSSFIERWVIQGMAAKLQTEATVAHLSFNEQCQHCEKESINQSLGNLLTYPWIAERVQKEVISINGGYYDFLNCTFERWTIDTTNKSDCGKRILRKDHELWC